MTATGTSLFSRDDLRTMRFNVFRERQYTLDEAVASYSIAALKEHLDWLWSSIRLAVAEAPQAAFERQPDDADSGDVWSAGQIVSHLCDAHVRSQHFWEDLLRCELPPPPARVVELQGTQLLEREHALEALASLAAAWAELMAQIGEDFDPEWRGIHPQFGAAGAKGALLVFSIHLDDHLHQIRDLYGA